MYVLKHYSCVLLLHSKEETPNPLVTLILVKQHEATVYRMKESTGVERPNAKDIARCQGGGNEVSVRFVDYSEISKA